MTTSDQPPGKASTSQVRTGPPLDRKPAHLSWESFAERRIREAEENGAFANLPGIGQPIPGIDQPLEENWWVKKKLREENLSVLPPTLQARRTIELVREEIRHMRGEQAVRRRLEKLNESIREAIYSTAAGPADGVQLVDIEAEMKTWREFHSRRPRAS